MNRGVLFLGMIAVAFLQACGGGSSSNTKEGLSSTNADALSSVVSSESSSSTPAQAAELEGVWKKFCGAADLSDPDTHYDIITVTFSGNTLFSSIENYEDASCSVALSFAPNPTASGTFSIGNSVTLIDATQAMELDSHINTYNGAEFKIDEYGLYRIEGDVVYFEDDTEVKDGSTPELRPNTLNYNRPFYRQ